MDSLRPIYFFRIDDVTPGMNWENFSRIQKICDTYNIKPIIGVVPDNKDRRLDAYERIGDFWGKIRELHEKGWTIAQHGYEHRYSINNSGILNINKYSEFAGLSYEEQYNKILAGKKIFDLELGFAPKWWMAPAHSFDEITCKVLRELDFEYITDGIAIFPFEKYGLKWLPQQIWKPKKQFFGVWTICLHVNKYDSKFIGQIENFCKNNLGSIQSQPEIFRYSTSYFERTLNFLYKCVFFIGKHIYTLFHE